MYVEFPPHHPPTHPQRPSYPYDNFLRVPNRAISPSLGRFWWLISNACLLGTLSTGYFAVYGHVPSQPRPSYPCRNSGQRPVVPLLPVWVGVGGGRERHSVTDDHEGAATQQGSWHSGSWIVDFTRKSRRTIKAGKGPTETDGGWRLAQPES